MKNFFYKKMIFILFLGLQSPYLFADWIWAQCKPDEVGQVDVGSSRSRIHVRCTKPIKDGSADIIFLTLPTSDPSSTNLLTIVDSSIKNNNSFNAAFISNDTSGASYGCDAINCRKLVGFVEYDSSLWKPQTVNAGKGIVIVRPYDGIVNFCSTPISSTGTPVGACAIIGSVGASNMGFDVTATPTGVVIINRAANTVYQCTTISNDLGGQPTGSCKNLGNR